MGSTGCQRISIYVSLLTIIMAASIGDVAGSAVSSRGYGIGRQLMQSNNGTEATQQVDDDTVRADPLHHLKKYREGYDIRNKDYWSSTIFTGIYGYSIAVFWLLCGIGYGAYLVADSFRNKNKSTGLKRKRSPCRLQCYLWPKLLAIVLTILAIIGTGVVLGGNAKFHSRAKTVVDILIDTADDAVGTVYSTTSAIRDMSTTLAANGGSRSTSSFLSSTYQSLDSEADDIEREATKNRRAIHKGLNILYIITTVSISVNLVAMIALSVFGVLRLRKFLYMFILLCWILTGLCWLFFGIYFFLSNFAGDTCTAFEGFQKDPYNNSLSSLLPCDKLHSAKSVLKDASKEVHNLVNDINHNIASKYGKLVKICNPFSSAPEYQYQPDKCPSNSIQIGDIPQLLKQISCPDFGGDTCTGGILIPAKEYYMIESYATSTQRLLDVYPDMNSLVECQTVTKAFTEILNDHCRPLKRYARMVWTSTVFLSVVMVALVLIWTSAAHHEQHQHPSDGSVKPYSTDIDMLDPGSAKISKLDLLPTSVL